MILMAAFVLLFGTNAYFIYDHYIQEEQQAAHYICFYAILIAYSLSFFPF